MAQQPIELILFRQLATSLAVPVFLVDKRGDLAYINEAAERLLGIRFDEMDRLPLDTWATMFRPRGPDGELMGTESVPLVVALHGRRPWLGPVRITGADGVERTIAVTAFPLEGAHDRLFGAVAMFWESAPE